MVEELSPFADVLNETSARDLTQRTLEWARMHQVFAGDRLSDSVRLAVAASVFARLCAPAVATERQYDVAARFTLLFFYIDDAPSAELSSLLVGHEPWSVGRLTPSLHVFLNDFHEMRRCTPALRDRLFASYHGYLGVRRDELAYQQRCLSIEEHWAFRRKTIFMDPYIDLWMILLGIDTTPWAIDPFATARQLATDLVLLSNDLGSMERDRPEGLSPNDLNLIDTYVMERGWSRDAAVDYLVGEHNRMVVELRKALETVAYSAETSSASRYADLLVGIVGGNLGALRVLRFRYTGIASMLGRLDAIDGAFRRAQVP